MKIAQVAPLCESVPPQYYGGTERIVSYLTEELVDRGHDVTLFASGDSKTKARLEVIVDRGLRLDKCWNDPLAHHMRLIDRVVQMAHKFDVIHFHTDYLHFPVAQLLSTPHVTTLHGRLDLPDLKPLYRHFNTIPVVSISDNQREPVPYANWVETIFNGVPEALYTLHPEPGKYLVFIGRISPEKRVDRAIEIAIRSGMPIRIAAKVDKVDTDYFNTHIRAMFDHPLVDFIGEISDNEKNELLGNAYALLFPIDWPEPFGLTMIEAMATGTPVIAYRRGSVPEIMVEGQTGFIVENQDEAVAAVEKIAMIDRRRCQRIFNERYSARRMAENYVATYQKVIDTTDRTPIAV